MAQCCYKTHREDPQTFPKTDAVSASQLLLGNTKGISNQYPKATRIHPKLVFKKFVYKKILNTNSPCVKQITKKLDYAFQQDGAPVYKTKTVQD